MTVHEDHSKWPDLEQFSDTPVFNTKAVVQQTGIAAPTLRAWERRYDLLSPGRANNDYRLYSERDIALIRWLKERIDTGMSISQAIALFHHLNEVHQQIEHTLLGGQDPAGLGEDALAFQIALENPMLQPNPLEPPGGKRELQYPPLIHGWPQTNMGYRSTSYPATHNMLLARERLIDVFRILDEATATMIMGSMLAIYSVEQVCYELITPTMWQIGQLWADGHITVAVEHFASNFFRALLTNLFYVTSSPRESPLIIVCCAPGEPHELAALMLALLLRRQNTHVVYLGQSIETSGLLHIIRILSPALICISLTIPTYLPALTNLAVQVEKMPTPRPIVSFGGQAFIHREHVIPQIPGIYLHGNLTDTIARLHHMVMEHSRDKI